MPLPSKRYVKVNVSQQFNYHTEAFNHLVKMLYPKRSTINKYDYLIDKHAFFTEPQKQVISKTASSLCMLSEFYRDQDKFGNLYVTREDICNAIHILQRELDLTNRSVLLSPVLRWYATQIQYHFGSNPFTLKQLRLQLRKGKSRIYEVVRELEYQKIVKLVGQQGHAHVFELVEHI
ncbi:hypothetical protein [Aquimarina agarivorans]|uniref:hypothetical protein n=1 Tax=Aquimarina agarivorans TaxID=980584 RepID=UPI000248F5AC|nr:hypothetical protein [Aquimarina agarivorans]